MVGISSSTRPRARRADYGGSARDFAEQGDARNLYNLGNAMAQQGEYDSAIDAYEQVLEMEPDNEDARYNLDFVRNLKEQQEQQQGWRFLPSTDSAAQFAPLPGTTAQKVALCRSLPGQGRRHAA